MTSPLPPKRRDTRDSADLIRQLKQNARQLGVGFVGGRYPPARPLGVTAQLGEVEDDDPLDDDQPAAINTDHATATIAGTIILTLTYVPIDGTLRIYWNGIYQPSTDYTLSGQTVTFHEFGVQVGDSLDAAYWYWPSDVEEPEPPPPASPLSSLTLRGYTTDGTLPAATQVGDLIVVASQWADAGTGAVVSTDDRLTAYGIGESTSSNVWVGRATSLGDPTFANTAFRSCMVIATFVEAAAVDSAQNDTAVVNTFSITAIPGIAAVAGVTDAHDTVTGSGSLPSPWVIAGTTGNGLVHASIYYWFDSGATDTPASTATFNGGPGIRTVTQVTLEAAP